MVGVFAGSVAALVADCSLLVSVFAGCVAARCRVFPFVAGQFHHMIRGGSFIISVEVAAAATSPLLSWSFP